ncbi:MAG: cytochrome C oxidase subunit IV family protein [Flavobacteriaceae bacterium]|uniref:cytochrome C oxidase subunit IV family protein n=1 Tax=Mariniflexile sp. TaxID=1979402 RepID=UPI003C845E25
MHKTSTITYIILIVLTITSAVLSKFSTSYIAILILLLAVLKFIGISFQFMELKKANPFWKGMVLGFLLLFTAIVLAVK